MDPPSPDGSEAPSTDPPSPRRRLRRRPRPEAAAATADDGTDQPTMVVDAVPQTPLNPGRMRRERRRLIDRRQETVYHLGGLAFELHRRGLLEEEVMQRRAEDVADIDRAVIAIDEHLVELESERREKRRRVREAPPSGYCMSCGAPFRDAANFCFNCGAHIPRAEESPVAEADTQPTQVGGESETPTEVVSPSAVERR